MLSIMLIALFATVGIAALTSLADSGIKLRNAWVAMKHDMAQAQIFPDKISEGAVLVLRPVLRPGAPKSATQLAAAA
jgi:hypothetical protein